jgi:hypothetical protein
MNVREQIKKYITSQPEPKRSDMRELHRLTLQVSPECKLWFFDGKDSKNHLFPTLRLDMDFTHKKMPMEKVESFFKLV